MLFNSIQFLVFFIVVSILFYVLAPKYRWILLLIASCYFYVSFIPVYILILFFLILLDYFAAIKIEDETSESKKRLWLRLSLIGNLGILAVFKYYNFLNDNICHLFGLVSVSNPIPYLHIILPIGLSFHTFQSMSYTIDVYKAKVKAERHLGIYSLFVMFYPQLVAGPIERATSLLQQLKKNDSKLEFDNVAIGLSMMFWGLFKKVVVADTVALYVNSIYNNAGINHGITNIVATWLFAIQIYCDFSGYSDIAIGAGRVMGYRMMTNFSLPYFSKSITEFWRRWHISLSSWLRDYLYISFGGNRKGKIRTYLNLFYTMLLGGLWHGASWNFVIWGALNGLYLSVEKFLNLNFDRNNKPFLLKVLYTFITFNLICITWIFFRADTLENALLFIKNIFVIKGFMKLRIQDTSIMSNVVFGVIVLLLFEYFVLRKRSIEGIYRKHPKILMAFNIILVLFIILWGVSEGSQFIYFQF